MVWMGTYTQSFLPSISASNKLVLEQYKPSNAEYRVQLQGGANAR